MIVEYAGILAGLSLLAATLTGAYGQNVTAVFAADGAGVAAVGKAAHVQHVPSAGARAAYKKAPYSKPALRYLFALGWIGGTRNKTACGVTLLGEGAARDQAADGIRKNPKLRAQLARRSISVTAAANALTKGVVSACD